MSTASNSTPQIDPRGPRFAAGITTFVFIAVLWLGLPTATTPQFDAAWWLLIFATVMFAWGTVLGPARHPYSYLFRTLIRPRLQKPSFMEDQAPPRFALLVGFVVSLVGVVLHLAGVPYGLVAASAAALIAAVLNAFFGLCLGCEMYNAILRLRGVTRA